MRYFQGRVSKINFDVGLNRARRMGTPRSSNGFLSEKYGILSDKCCSLLARIAAPKAYSLRGLIILRVVRALPWRTEYSGRHLSPELFDDSGNLTEFRNRSMLASRLEEMHMRERTKRFAIALLMTTVDIALLDRYIGAIWQAWSEVLWSRGAFLLLLALLVASAAVLWIHVYYDLRQTMRERRDALSLKATSLPGDLRRDGDV